MAYIPPHQRLPSLGGSSRRPQPAFPPPITSAWSSRSASPSGSPTQRPRRDGKSLPRVDIVWARGAQTRLLVVVETPNGSCDDEAQLEFVRFEGDRFPHLQSTVLYTLRVVPSADTGSPSSLSGLEKPVDLLKLSINPSCEEGEEVNRQRVPWLSIAPSVRKYLNTALEHLKGYLEVRRHHEVLPRMAVRLGQLLFNNKTGGSIPSGILTARTLEDNWAKGARYKNLTKTFDTSLTFDFFSFLGETATKESQKSTTKDRYIIIVEDEMQPDITLVCSCSHVGSRETKLVNSSSENLPQLILEKVNTRPVRHMIADIVRVGKRSDIRLVLYTKHRVDLSTEERAALEAIVSKATINENVKGGLYWPLGCSDTPTTRFKVSGSWHVKKIRVNGATVKWVLQHANRTEFDFSSGRSAYEVTLKPAICNEYLKGRNEWIQEKIVESVEGFVEWVWKQCL